MNALCLTVLVTCVLCVPTGMQRRQTNSTRYDPRSRKLFWRLEWRFTPTATAAAALDTPEAVAGATDAAAPADPQEQQQQQQQVVTVFDGKVDEEALLLTVLTRHLEYRQGAGAQALQLREYREAGVEGLTLLMKKERCPVGDGPVGDSRLCQCFPGCSTGCVVQLASPLD
jgi:hypothetical protein